MQMDTVEAVKAANAQIQDTYDQALAAWSNAPKASRNKNPPARSRKCVAQTLACYCCLQNSMGKLTGFGCAVCVATVDAGGGYDKTCAVCSCPCKVVFYRHKRDTVARESSKKPPAQQYEPAEASVTSLLQCFRHDGYRETVLREEREKGFFKVNGSYQCTTHQSRQPGIDDDLCDGMGSVGKTRPGTPDSCGGQS